MKTILRSILTLITVLLISSCNRIAPENRVLHKSEKDAVLVVDVPKAGCKNCQKVVETGLAKEAGVKQSILNLHTKQVSVVYNPEEITAESLKSKTLSLATKIPCK